MACHQRKFLIFYLMASIWKMGALNRQKSELFEPQAKNTWLNSQSLKAKSDKLPGMCEKVHLSVSKLKRIPAIDRLHYEDLNVVNFAF